MPEAALFGLIGYPLSHSFSAGYFQRKFEKEKLPFHYRNFELEHIQDFETLIKTRPNLKGLNVTIPYKMEVMNYLDEMDETAAAVGAVNVIRFENGIRKGFNTDGPAFARSLKPLINDRKNALILGTGGASQAVQWALRKLNIPFQVVSRREKSGFLTYATLNNETLASYEIVINTTPLGMAPEVSGFPDLPYEGLTNRHLLYDLIYNPAETLFLKKGKAQGCSVRNGTEMLELQAELSWTIWNQS